VEGSVSFGTLSGSDFAAGSSALDVSLVSLNDLNWCGSILFGVCSVGTVLST
jgi:hypothetical protein